MAGRKLFLADDSLTIQKVINLTFADEGIEVLTAGDGDSALQRIPEVMPDLVLADVNMPGLNGYELCELLRGDYRTRHIPVILLVGVFEQFDEAEAARVGSTAHLTKPFQSIRQLINQVTDLIDAGRPAPEPEPEPEPEPVPYEIPVSQSVVNPFDEPVPTQAEPVFEDPSAPSEDGSSPDFVTDDRPAEPLSSGPEGEDIDRLYRQSIGEEPVAASDDDFPDLGVDDEMIETSYTAAQPDENEIDLLEPGTEEPALELEEVAPFVEENWNETGTAHKYETAELDLADLPVAEDVPAAPRSYDTVRLDPSMVEAKMAEVNRRFEEIEQPQPLDEAPEAPIGEDTVRMNTRFDTQGSGDFQLEEVDLLDIPTGVEVDVMAPAEAAAQGGKQVVTLSPEMIEMIAQRVVEKLAEKH